MRFFAKKSRKSLRGYDFLRTFALQLGNKVAYLRHKNHIIAIVRSLTYLHFECGCRQPLNISNEGICITRDRELHTLRAASH